MTLPVFIRAMGDRDRAFVADAWLRSYRTSDDMAGVPSALYYEVMRGLVDGLLINCSTLVVASKEDPDQLYAFANAVPGLLNYVYTKHTFRGMGFARMLLDALAIPHASLVGFRTDDLKLMMWRGRIFVYAPTLAYYASNGNFEHSVFRSGIAYAQGLCARSQDNPSAV